MFEAPPHVPVVDDDSTPSVSSQQWQMARNLVGIDRKGKSDPQTRQDTTRQDEIEAATSFHNIQVSNCTAVRSRNF